MFLRYNKEQKYLFLLFQHDFFNFVVILYTLGIIFFHIVIKVRQKHWNLFSNKWISVLHVWFICVMQFFHKSLSFLWSFHLSDLFILKNQRKKFSLPYWVFLLYHLFSLCLIFFNFKWVNNRIIFMVHAWIYRFCY